MIRGLTGPATIYRVELVENGVVVRSEPAGTRLWAYHVRDEWAHLPSSLAGRTQARVLPIGRPVEHLADTGVLQDRAADDDPPSAARVVGVPRADAGTPTDPAVHDATCPGRSAAWHDPVRRLAGCARCGALVRCEE